MTATAATLRERAQADQLAADALALVIDSGYDAATIRATVMADVFRRGLPGALTREQYGLANLDDHEIHAVLTAEMLARAELHPLGDRNRGWTP